MGALRWTHGLDAGLTAEAIWGKGGGARKPAWGSAGYLSFVGYICSIFFCYLQIFLPHLQIFLPKPTRALRMGGGERIKREGGALDGSQNLVSPGAHIGWIISTLGQFQLVSFSCQMMHVIIYDVINVSLQRTL